MRVNHGFGAELGEVESPLTVYRRYLEQDQLAHQFDLAADTPVFFPRVMAPRTGAVDLEWRVGSGRGVVYSVTVISPKGGDPYNVALVDVDEGYRMMSRIDDVASEDVSIGMRVRFKTFRPGEGGAPYPVFVPE